MPSLSSIQDDEMREKNRELEMLEKVVSLSLYS
jgi:hypothetical protein